MQSERSYRLVIKSAERISGAAHDFTWSPPHSWPFHVDENCNVKVMVESTTPVSIGTLPSARAEDNKLLLVELVSPAMHQQHTHQSWDGATSKAVALLQSYSGSGYYGRSANAQYVSMYALAPTYPMSHLINNINQLHFRLRLWREGSGFQGLSTESVGDWSMSLVLLIYRQHVDRPLPLHDLHMRLWFDTRGKQGTLDSFTLPVRIDYDDSVFQGKKWFAAIEHASTIRELTVQPENVLSLQCPTLLDAREDGSESIYDFVRAAQTAGDAFLGERLITNSWLTSHHIGHQVTRNPREVQALEFKVVDGLTGAALADASQYSDFVFCLTLWQARA